jgi:hypothetical protein
MERLQRLPAREPPLPGESLSSLLRRTAAAMGYDNVNLLTRQLGPTWKPHQDVNRTGPGPHLGRLGELLGFAPDELLRRTVHRFAGALVLRPVGGPPASLCDDKTALRYFAARASSVCPECLVETAPAYDRLVWGFRPLRVCVRHACPLLDCCPACGNALPPGRKDPARCPCGNALPKDNLVAVSPATLRCAQVLERWLDGAFAGIPQVPAAVGFWLAERLAAAVSTTPGWLARAADRFGMDPVMSSESFCRAVAVDAFEGWPECLCELLNAGQRAATERNGGGVHPFSPLLRDAVRLEELGYAAPAEVLRRYLLEHYTAGHVNRKVRLFRGAESERLLRGRPWYTKTEAAAVLQVRNGTIVDLLHQGFLEGRIRPAGGHGRSIGVVSRASVETLKRSLAEGLDVTRVRLRLRTGRSQVFGLIRAGLLKAVRTRKGWIILRQDISAIENLLEGLPHVASPRTSWLSLRQATRVYGPAGLNLARAIELVRAGRVAACADRRFSGLRGLWLFQPDLESQLPALRVGRCRVHGHSLCQLAKILLPGRPCREPVLKKWIRAGLLRAGRRGRAWVVPPEEVERFRAEYCLADEACALLGVSRSTLSRWETEGRLTPAYGRKVSRGAGFSLYRRADLRAVRRARRPAGGLASPGSPGASGRPD